MEKPKASWDDDLDLNDDEETFYDHIEDEEDARWNDQEAGEADPGAEDSEEEEAFFSDESDDDGEAANDGDAADGESGDNDLEEQMYAAATDEASESD